MSDSNIINSFVEDLSDAEWSALVEARKAAETKQTARATMNVDELRRSLESELEQAMDKGDFKRMSTANRQLAELDKVTPAQEWQPKEDKVKARDECASKLDALMKYPSKNAAEIKVLSKELAKLDEACTPPPEPPYDPFRRYEHAPEFGKAFTKQRGGGLPAPDGRM